MTSDDHNPDAVIAALRSPALPAEQVGEAASVTAMLEVLPSTTPSRVAGLRSRRGVSIAAVTIASLGLGGLAAAGPGIFQPAADAPPAVVPSPDVTTPDRVDREEVPGDGGAIGEPGDLAAVATGTTDDSEPDDAVECADGNHGQTVSSVAQATESGPDKGAIVSEAARSDCGKPDRDTESADEPDDTSEPGDAVECADGNHGQTVSSVAQATESGPDKGAIVSEAARSDCGKPDRDTESADEPDEPDDGDIAPEDSSDAPGQSGDAPGRSGEATGRSGDAPGRAKQQRADTAGD